MKLKLTILVLLGTLNFTDFSLTIDSLPAGYSIIKIDDVHHTVFKNLQICYECEFAPITQTHMTSNGDYDQNNLASHWSSPYDLYLFYKNKIPVGFCVVNHHSMVNKTKDSVHDIAEFYITPIFRKNGLGTLFARQIIMLYPGSWEIRQFLELEKTARQFWLKVIEGVPHTNFQEIMNHTNWFGFIQRFDI